MNYSAPVGLYGLPCSWVFVDDELRFLEAIRSYLPREQPSKFFDSPLKAMRHLERSKPITEVGSWKRMSSHELHIGFDLNELTRIVCDRSRFGSISVVVSDFAMPGIDGIEFFQNFAGERFGKILLTGVADERVAVDAFNAGVIDRFIVKGAPDAILQMESYARELEARALNSNIETAALALDTSGLSRSSEFRVLFEQQLLDCATIEYYYSKEPQGFLLLDAQGNARFLSLFEEADLERRQALTSEIDCPLDIKQGSKERRLASFLFEQPVQVGDNYDWVFNTIAIKQVPGIMDWYYGIHEDPPLDVDFHHARHSLNAFLEGSGS